MNLKQKGQRRCTLLTNGHAPGHGDKGGHDEGDDRERAGQCHADVRLGKTGEYVRSSFIYVCSLVQYIGHSNDTQTVREDQGQDQAFITFTYFWEGLANNKATVLLARVLALTM